MTTPSSIWTAENFYAPDDDTNILWDETGTNIKAATLPKLLTKITCQDTNMNFLHDFMFTYRSFTKDGLELLEGLKARVACATEAEESRLIKLKVFNVLRVWVEKFWFDFLKDCPSLANKTVEWLDTIVSDPAAGGGPGPEYSGSAKVAAGLRDKLLRKLVTPEKKPAIQAAPKGAAIQAKDLTCNDIFECKPEIIAGQLTLIEWDLWSQIKPYEFLDLAWTKKDKGVRCSNLLAMVERFNYVSSWVATRVCMEERLQDRVKLVSKLIQIASKLRSLNNFNGLMAILSGLNRGPVYRLRQTVAALEKKKEGRVYRLWQDLVNLTSSDHSYNVVRKALKSVSPPSIPYLGMYLTDLTFIEEGNKKFLTEHKLINFFKRRLTAATIVDIQTYQNLGYAVSPLPEIQAKLQGEPTFDEDSLYELSLYLEPRPGQTRPEKPQLLITGLPLKREEQKEIEVEFDEEWSQFSEDNYAEVVVDGELIGMNLYKLVGKITHPTRPDSYGILPFLPTLPFYSTPQELFRLLVLRLQIPPPVDKSALMQKRYSDELSTPISLKVDNALRVWIQNYWEHFENDPQFKQELLDFISGTFSQSSPQLASGLELMIKEQEKLRSTPPAPPPPSIVLDSTVTAKTAKLSDFDPLEVARQLTLMSSQIFSQISAEELFCTGNKGQFIGVFEDHIVDITAWVLEEIDLHRQENMTHVALENLVNIAYHCAMDLSNYHAVCGIFNALNLVNDNIKDAWSELDTTSSQVTFYTEKKDLFSEYGKQQLNDLLKSLQPPCVPVIRPFVGEIELLHQQHPQNKFTDYIINVGKIRKIGKVIMEVKKLHKPAYSLEEVPVIQEYLQRPRSLWEVVRCLKESYVTERKDERSILLDMILRNSNFKTTLSSIVSEVVTNEWKSLHEELNLVLSGSRDFSKPSPNAECIPHPRFRAVVKAAFPGCSFSCWTHYDAHAAVAPTPQVVNATIVHTNNTAYRCILAIKENFTKEEAAKLVKLGALYKSQHQGILLSCVVFTSYMSESAAALASQCKLKVVLVQ